MPSFACRSGEQEIMDDLLCSGEVVNQTLRELEVINHWLGGNNVTMEGVRYLLKGHPRHGSVSLADLGCGSGDMLKHISDWGQMNNVNFHLTGIDANPHIIEFASNRFGNYRNILFETTNILSPHFSAQKFDIIVATLFTHHFSDQELINILAQLKSQAHIGVVINDIHRHWLAFHSIRLLTRIFSRSAMVKFDAPLSVLRAFRRRELESLLRGAGITHYHLRWKWAFRWQLIIPAKEAPL